MCIRDSPSHTGPHTAFSQRAGFHQASSAGAHETARYSIQHRRPRRKRRLRGAGRVSPVLAESWSDALATLAEHEELGIVLVGRPYNIYDAGVNMDIPAKLRKYYGVNVIPMDFLPTWDTETRDINPNMYWNWGRRILQTTRMVEQYPNLHVIYMSNFKCGPDSYIKHFVRGSLSEPFLSLQFDEHTNDAGAMTRCEAYLDSKGFLRWWARDTQAAGQKVLGGAE